MEYEIYRITRPTIDDAVYYGQHCLQKRGGKRYMGSGKKILASLKKHGRKIHAKGTRWAYAQENIFSGA
jgi:hypothetical protein